MELGKRIKEYRNVAGMNQDQLAEKMFVSRQTISNWENDKSYPDIQSLLLLGEIFDVSLDQLVKGDIEVMKNIINEKDVRDMDRYGKMMLVGMIVMAVSVAPLFICCGLWGLIPFFLNIVFLGYVAGRIEEIKKQNDIQSYKEIVAFSNGETLDEITKQQEIGKRPYQKAWIVLAVSAATAVIAGIVGAIILFLI